MLQEAEIRRHLPKLDIAIVRFGLQDTALVTPVIVCGWFAVASSVPLAYTLERDRPNRGGFGVVRVLGLALWTFSLFLILFLLGRAARLSTGASWLSSKTGLTSVLAHGIVSISAEPTKSLYFAQQVLFLAMSFSFLWIVLPFLFYEGNIYKDSLLEFEFLNSDILRKLGEARQGDKYHDNGSFATIEETVKRK